MTDAFLARIDSFNSATRAYITVTPDAAIRAASDCDRRLAAGDQAALLGVPFGTKDLIDIAGVLTTGGSRVLAENIAADDAAIIVRLRSAGAVSLGKTNLHEFAYGVTGENDVYGTPASPYDPTRLACGSSSGSAVAVACGLAAFALGTDTGGSVRVPAVLNGLVGLKPTFGSISTEGVIPFCWSLDHVGLITRTIGDCIALLRACARTDTTENSSDLAGLRVGVPDDFFGQTDPEIVAATEDAIAILRRAGVRIAKVALPDARHSRTVSLTIQMPEALSFHSRYLEERGPLYGKDLRAGLALGQYILAEHYVRAKRLVTRYREGVNAVLKDVDVILTPATPIPAPPIGTASIAIGGVDEAIGNALTRFTSFFNMTGHPAVTLANAMHSLGLPIGIQLVGRHHDEPTMLAAAGHVAAESPHIPPPAMS